MSHFTVKVKAHAESARSMEPDTLANVRDEFYVELPHQCDEWVAAYGSRDDAIAQMEQFIADAQDALARLREIPTCPHEWVEVPGAVSKNNAGMQQNYHCERCSGVVYLTVDKSTAPSWYVARYYTEPAAS